METPKTYIEISESFFFFFFFFLLCLFFFFGEFMYEGRTSQAILLAYQNTTITRIEHTPIGQTACATTV